MRMIFGANPPTGGEPAANAPGTRLPGMTRAMRKAYLQLFGIPDYERYVEHMASHHPDEPLLSRREFCAKAIDRKYAHNGPRCC
ncbi:YbdD/YjiX family protein [Paraburkholderia sp. BL10I2N1]|uniref:YbdD/YjiX family protein n=1 Tax=Paraburkholderia sp. BL10I2N1 TaxID=1938796 RepID=UPI00105FCAAC|nr:YbdD/YjiX family protein [Paraburkholderia sp. BL10I2N1]TDN62211.1 uncharacterized short protein YbdD (DUF466 family) [Paraburkholderia sp. BL10I2N1]